MTESASERGVYGALRVLLDIQKGKVVPTKTDYQIAWKLKKLLKNEIDDAEEVRLNKLNRQSNKRCHNADSDDDSVSDDINHGHSGTTVDPDFSDTEYNPITGKKRRGKKKKHHEYDCFC